MGLSSLTTTDWLVIVAIVLVFFAGVQLNRIERQNERLSALLHEISQRLSR